MPSVLFAPASVARSVLRGPLPRPQQQQQQSATRAFLRQGRRQQQPRRTYSSPVDRPPGTTTTGKPSAGNNASSSSSSTIPPSSSSTTTTSSSSSFATSGASSAAGRAGAEGAERTTSRFARMHGRLPRFLQRYTGALLSAPVSHVSAFLVLHELTAVVPLAGFGWYFYRADSLPWFAPQGVWFDAGVQKFGSYFRRKGWLGGEEQDRLRRLEIQRGHAEGLGDDNGAGGNKTRWWPGRKKEEDEMLVRGPNRTARWWMRGENGVHLVTSVATAYALTKMLLPLRLVLSVWATPAFARVFVVPIANRTTNGFKRIMGMFKRK